jgi:hypothetical protein
VHTSYHEEYPMSPMNHYDSYPCSDAQSTDKPRELVSDDNVEGCDEKKNNGSEEVAVYQTSDDRCVMRYTSPSARLIAPSANCTQ